MGDSQGERSLLLKLSSPKELSIFNSLLCTINPHVLIPKVLRLGKSTLRLTFTSSYSSHPLRLSLLINHYLRILLAWKAPLITMAENDRRNQGYRGDRGGRKRRYRGERRAELVDNPC